MKVTLFINLTFLTTNYFFSLVLINRIDWDFLHHDGFDLSASLPEILTQHCFYNITTYIFILYNKLFILNWSDERWVLSKMIKMDIDDRRPEIKEWFICSNEENWISLWIFIIAMVFIFVCYKWITEVISRASSFYPNDKNEHVIDDQPMVILDRANPQYILMKTKCMWSIVTFLFGKELFKYKISIFLL